MDNKRTVVFGATPNPSRYAYMAANMLRDYGHEIVPVSIKRGKVAGEEIIDLLERPEIDDVDTVTLYVGSQNLGEWIDYILDLKPKRIIFNPGTENLDLERKAREKGIEVVIGCTLVMLRSNTY
ncbi:MAG: CoA-binding protein [Candidatus Cyclobacteriaceae bacterium M2_1C_046]